MLGEELHGTGAEGHRRSFHVPTVPPQEKVGQCRNVLFALAQGRHSDGDRSEEHTSNSSHLVISYAVFCLKKKKKSCQDERTARSSRRTTLPPDQPPGSRV